MQLEDGYGSGNRAKVAGGKVSTVSTAESPLLAASKDGNAFSWFSGVRDIDAGDTMLFIKNTGEDDLVIDDIQLNGSNVICLWEINVGAATTTPSGTAVDGVNLNRNSSKTADVLAYYDETAVADGTTVAQAYTPVTNTVVLSPAIILGKNQYLQINQETESTSGSVVVFGHFE